MSQAVNSVAGKAGKLVGLKNLFKTPSPPEAPPTAAPDTKAVQVATAEAAQRRSRARGFQSTILSQQNQSELKSTYGS
jgi:hypothetical protein